MSDERMTVDEGTSGIVSGVTGKHIAAAKTAEKNIGLAEYQKASVDFISQQLKSHKKVLLADEVGLGKTIIAKGVVARLAQQYWETKRQKGQEGEKPFRVAYLCPNQNVANQNNPKFRNMFPDKLLAPDEKKVNDLKTLLPEIALGNLEDLSEKDLKKKTGLTPKQREYLLKPEGSVYTRLCRWLIGIYSGKTLREAMTDYERTIYLPDEGQKPTHIPSEKRTGSMPAKKGDGTKAWAKAHMTRVLDIAKVPVLKTFWKKYEGNEGENPSSEKYYAFNCLVVEYLTNQIEQDYRLSMQHLYTAESSQFSLGNTVQFESLTPETSFNIGKGKGTYQERALIFATLAVWFSKNPPMPDWLETVVKDKFKSAEGPRFWEAYRSYLGRLESLDGEVIDKMVQKEQLEEITEHVSKRTDSLKDENIYEGFIKKARKAFVENNVKHFLNYDLVIMDEFQNFSELIGCDGKKKKSEAYQIANALLNKKDCKVLLLSATPFSIDNCIPEGGEEEPDDTALSLDDRKPSGNTFDHFKQLVRFMTDPDTDPKDWLEKWNEHRDNPVECRKLMHKIGIFRTERNAASRHSPVIEQDLAEDLVPDFAARLHTNIFMKKDHTYCSAYGDSTPYPLVFGAGYQFSRKPEEGGYLPKALGEYYSQTALLAVQENIINDIAAARKGNGNETRLKQLKEEWDRVKEKIGNPVPLPDKDKRLFLKKEDLDGSHSVETGHARFEALKKDLLKAQKGGFSTASMLWIPPCDPSHELRGAFAGRKGFSKTLIFSHYQMTPLAFTYLLCNEAGARIKQTEQEKQKISFHISFGDKSEISGAGNDVTVTVKFPGQGKQYPEYPDTAKAFSEYFTDLFSESVGIAAVRSVHSDCEYVKAVIAYCEDGCFCDMLAEYTGLLAAELGGSDAKMAHAVKKVKEFKISNPKLNLLEENWLTPQQIQAANQFAVGLFSENENGSDLVRRMANIKNAFNSPFWPFVFTSTSIGAEGIDLHWYARNIVHWYAPARPLDIEQREGRVLRYRCHALRLNESLGAVEEKCVEEKWIGSGMFGKQLNYFADKEGDGEEECYHVIRKTCFEPESGEKDWFERGKKIVAVYRSVLGTSSADELLKKGELAAGGTEAAVLDLSPWLAR